MTSPAKLIEIERTLWTNDAAIYGATYLEDAVLIFPGIGRIDLISALAAIREENVKGHYWADVSFSDVRARDLSADIKLLTYTATARWNYEPLARNAICSTIYVSKSDRWRIAAHQQTDAPLQPSS